MCLCFNTFAQHMTIFDVIRYPISDIYKADELDALPDDLYTKWYYRCAGEYCKKTLTNSRCREINAIITIQARASARGNRYQTGNLSYHDLWKAIFTKMLKEMIKDYDPE